MAYTVVFSPEARDQLLELLGYITGESSAQVAANFTGGIVDYCEGFAIFPRRGTLRDDIRPGLRMVGYKRRVSIAFTVSDELVTILGVFYGGQNYEAALQVDDTL